MRVAHLPYAALEERLLRLAPPPKDEGRVELVVVRPTEGERLTPARCGLTPDGGVLGDRWAKRESPVAAAQIAVMRHGVAAVIANGQPLSLFGDNLLVDLDLSRENLPDGTRLAVGTALCEVTPKPHNGCAKFETRFGKDARAIMAAEAFCALRLRGVYIRVVEAGEVGPGAYVTVIRRTLGA